MDDENECKNMNIVVYIHLSSSFLMAKVADKNW
jgi:hypothetical protein